MEGEDAKGVEAASALQDRLAVREAEGGSSTCGGGGSRKTSENRSFVHRRRYCPSASVDQRREEGGRGVPAMTPQRTAPPGFEIMSQAVPIWAR